MGKTALKESGKVEFNRVASVEYNALSKEQHEQLAEQGNSTKLTTLTRKEADRKAN